MGVQVRYLKDGTKRYVAEVFVGQKPSKRQPGKMINAYDRKSFSRERDAKDWIADHRVKKIKNPNYNPRAGEKPFTEVVELWRRTRLVGMSPRSRDRYESVLKHRLMPAFGHENVGAISAERVEMFFGDLRDSGLAFGTVKKVHTVLSSIMSTAKRRGFIDVNPASRLEALAQRDNQDVDSEPLILAPGEVHLLADVIGAKHPPYRTLILTAAFTGLRAGELHALRRRDVDLIRGELHVRRALKIWRAGVAEFGAPKTKKSRRTVALMPQLVQLLSEHLANRKPDDLVFQSMRGGGPIHQVAFLRNFFRPAQKEVLPDHPTLRFHDLRHTFVSMLIAKGVNVKAIAKQTGHTSAAMVLDTYGHLYNDDADRIVREALSAAYTEAQQPNVTPLRAAGGRLNAL